MVMVVDAVVVPLILSNIIFIGEVLSVSIEEGKIVVIPLAGLPSKIVNLFDSILTPWGIVPIPAWEWLLAFSRAISRFA